MTAIRARQRRQEKALNHLRRLWRSSLWHLPDHGQSVPLPLHLHDDECQHHGHGTWTLCCLATASTILDEMQATNQATGQYDLPTEPPHA